MPVAVAVSVDAGGSVALAVDGAVSFASAVAEAQLSSWSLRSHIFDMSIQNGQLHRTRLCL